jgi:hypothetical protein
MITLQDILEIENDEEILGFKCPESGYLLWPPIRNVFIRFVISDLLYQTPLFSEECPSLPQKAYASVVKACAHNMLKRQMLKGPILISATGSHVLRDGQYFNRLSDHFAFAAHEKTVTLESLFIDWHWPFPRHNKRVLFDAPLLAIASLFGKFAVCEKHVEAAGALVKFLGRRALKVLGWSLSETRSGFLTAILARHLASLPVRRWLYTRLFQRTGTRILIREGGCYGDSSVINAVARECGVVTAEYQHGAVSSGHDAYNFARVLCSSEEYKKTLPQYFLAYGRWWADQINVPAEKLDIGNPDRAEFLRSTAKFVFEKTDIVVLGDGHETEKYLSLCTVLAESLSTKYRIVFRPHPLERECVQRLYGGKVGKIVIEWKRPIYEAFGAAEIVVSELSTGLFEAIGLVNRIFLWDTSKAKFCYPSHPFTAFFDADDLIAKIKDDETGRVDSSTAEEFWAPYWKENYLAFLESVCPGILDSDHA